MQNLIKNKNRFQFNRHIIKLHFQYARHQFLIKNHNDYKEREIPIKARLHFPNNFVQQTILITHKPIKIQNIWII